ncbi:DNA-processing protein DprA [Shewanella eurypsychrophilus]|uniref:DNA-processing protein DprA n=1 Tax=Shewanella eurypsychrophilus TaxID=2593656 RepID=A0ABX6V2L3_9GAMM|nr:MULTISPECIES: DNA-processing protein DprA [Shewanella]QFU20448.1 DNA-protecting protein DprA [Shewanella sp. YLB-09]QPG56025.1 DNA-processing protein DprA [Shewanella eurypsychrophilus]
MDVEELRQMLEHEQDALPLPESLLKCKLTPNFTRVESALAWQEAAENHFILTLDDPDYPYLLKQISDPPSVIFVKGDINALKFPCIGVVGSRAASRTGLQISYQLAAELSTFGFTVVSGMAVGIDGAAHQGCIDKNSRTLAVLGTGVDIVYPRRHRKIYEDIQSHGVIMSEFWPGTKPYAGNFPKRNRLISGLSVGTLVVEACRKSGSLITAKLALEQGREVFAVPGSILAGQSQGCHDLLKDGAKLVESAADIIEEVVALSQYHLEELRRRHHIGGEKASDLPFTSLLASVGYETTTLDVVVEHSGKAIDLVLEQLLELELQGWVAVVPGGYIRLKRS